MSLDHEAAHLPLVIDTLRDLLVEVDPTRAHAAIGPDQSLTRELKSPLIVADAKRALLSLYLWPLTPLSRTSGTMSTAARSRTASAFHSKSSRPFALVLEQVSLVAGTTPAVS